MKIFFAVLVLMSLSTAGRAAESVNFDSAETGKLPAGWVATQTGTGKSNWAVVPDSDAPSKPNVLKQSGEAQYPLCLNANTEIKDGFVEVKFKPVSGQKDQAGGIVWRGKDADNYYIARANALENNVVMYKTVAGKRFALDIVGRKGGYGLEAKVASNQWHTLRVEFAGAQFSLYFDGKKLFEVVDETFREAGKVGLWTKADSVTLFDDFTFGSK